MPDSAVPVVRRPVRRVPSSTSKDLPELRRLSVGELVNSSSSSSRGSSAEKEGGAAVGPRVLLRRSVKVKTGVDPAKKEEYLSDAEFVQVLGLQKEEFSSLPAWKQVNLKKNAGLF